MKQINYEMKVLYALGIIFVAAGHCGYGGISLGYDWFLPNAFHLGLFMFVSGYFYDRASEGHILAFIGHKLKRLILPLYLWNLFYALFMPGMKRLGFTLGEEVTLYNLFVAPWNNGHQFMYNLAGWFVPSLFLAHVVNVLFRKALGICFAKLPQNAQAAMDWLVEGIYLILGMIGVYFSMQGYYEGWYLPLVRLAYFLPFYGMGTLYRNQLENRVSIPNLWYFAVCMGIELLIISYTKRMPAYYPSWCKDFDSVWIPFVAGFCGIFFWLRIAKMLTPAIGQSKYVLQMSEYGYSIMINQFLGFFAVKGAFALGNKLLHLFGAFDWDRFHSDIWYYYLPGDLSQWLILYLTAGIVVPIWIGMGVKVAKNKWMEVRK